MKSVPQDLYHFVLAVIVLLGDGLLIWSDKGDSLPYATAGMVLAFYFTRAGSQAGAEIADVSAQHAAQISGADGSNKP